MAYLPVIPPQKKLLACLLGGVVFTIFYLGAGLIGVSRAVPLEQLYPDLVVPFISWTIWIYISHYIFIPFVFIVVKKAEYFSAMLFSVLLATIIASMIFVLHPTLMYRQPLVGDEPEDLARSLLYLVDLPTNCFPSLHVALAMIGAFFTYKQSRFLGVITVCWAALIIMSTMTIKQHYFADVVGGSVLAIISCALVLKLMKHPAKVG